LGEGYHRTGVGAAPVDGGLDQSSAAEMWNDGREWGSSRDARIKWGFLQTRVPSPVAAAAIWTTDWGQLGGAALLPNTTGLTTSGGRCGFVGERGVGRESWSRRRGMGFCGGVGGYGN
jgi:hypothetical protein